ncbi:MAG: lysophospholipid acyltransferase family protein [Bacteroidota bacterium]
MKVFYYLYTFYAWLVGGLIFFIVMIFSILIMNFISPKKFRPVFIFLLKFIFNIAFIRVKVEIPKGFDYNQRYVYMPNHVSILDAPLMVAYLPQFINALEAKEHFDWPFYGKLAAKWGNIPINRKSVQDSIKSVNKAKLKLVNENSIIVFPEGSRTKNGQLGKFKKLPFHLAQDTKVAIVPVGMSGVFSLNKKGTLLVKPGRIKIKLGNPISSEKVVSLSNENLMNETKTQIESLIEYI